MSVEKSYKKRKFKNEIIFILEESLQYLPHFDVIINALKANNV